jgi:hypothetical protein
MAPNRYPIGVSSYSDGTPTSPRGRMQTVTDQYLADQLRSAAVEFDRDVLKGNGEHLTPNEGVRELDRQWDLYNLYLQGRGALAAYPGTSTHGPQIGTAVDFGITRADGSNRPLDGGEWPQLYRILSRRGVQHTGALFRVYEAWHCNGIYDAELPPITNPPLMGTTAESTPGEEPAPKEAIGMKCIKGGTAWLLIGATGGTWKIGPLRVAGQMFDGRQVRDLLVRVEKSNADEPATFNDLQIEVIRAALKKIK